MKKINILKKVFILFILINILIVHSSVNASTTVDDVIQQGDSFVNAGKQSGQMEPIDGDKLKETSNTIYNIFLGVAIAVAVIVGAYLGIQFMMASAMDKAKYKEAMLPFVLGCIVAFGAFGIWRILVTMLNPLS